MSCSQSEQLEGELEGADVCACCGIAGVDDVKLKMCDGGCALVKYCSVECQENHREQHEEECKKRKAELHDKKIFTQPDISHMGECPICFLPLPLVPTKSIFMGCCSKMICKGCCYANMKREKAAGLEQRCPFCRNPAPKSQDEIYKNVMERIKKKDPVAMTEMGKRNRREGDYEKALEYFTKAVDLGDVTAQFCLATLYYKGEGVEKDMKKAVYRWEQAAIGGHPSARACLAEYEKNKGRFNRAAKHFIIAANLGHDLSLKYVKDLFVQGVVSKEDYAAALRAYQAAVNETKSAERDEAEAYYTS